MLFQEVELSIEIKMYKRMPLYHFILTKKTLCSTLKFVKTRFVVLVFDLMSLLNVMNSLIPLCIYVLQKLNGEWREEKNSELELARQYLRSAR